MSIDLKKLTSLGKIVEVGVRDPTTLKIAPTNNRTMPITEREKLEFRTSVQNIGVVEPLLLNMDEAVVSGQLRWASAIAAGKTEVPIIKMEFNDQFSERIASVIQDYLHHPLTEEDKGKFVEKCMKEDQRTMQDIADSLGVDVHTVRQWSRWNQVPETIKDNESLKQTYFELPGKKRSAIKTILNGKQFKHDAQGSTQFMEYATKASLRDLETARKDSVSNTPIDPVARLHRLDENTALLEIKIPKPLDTAFRKALRELNLDYVEVLVRLIQWFVRTRECPME